MMRFTLFGFPVFIHWMFWVGTALMGGLVSANTTEELLFVLGWMVAVFVSILIHELGHALTMRNYGDRNVGIVLYTFGGLAEGRRQLTRNEDMIVSAAGPALQILVGLAVGWAITIWRPTPVWLRAMLDSFTVVSIFWALLNLVPVIPLDGGRLCAAYLGVRGRRRALTISLVFAVVLALLSLVGDLWEGLQNSVLRILDIRAYTRVGGGSFTLIFFGMLAVNNWKQLRNEPQIPWMNAR